MFARAQQPPRIGMLRKSHKVLLQNAIPESPLGAQSNGESWVDPAALHAQLRLWNLARGLPSSCARGTQRACPPHRHCPAALCRATLACSAGPPLLLALAAQGFVATLARFAGAGQGALGAVGIRTLLALPAGQGPASPVRTGGVSTHKHSNGENNEPTCKPRICRGPGRWCTLHPGTLAHTSHWSS